MNKYVIAIDPGVTTGMALYNTETDEIEKLWSSTFWKAVDFCILHEADVIVVEVPSTKNAFNAQKGFSPRAMLKIAVNVGEVIREASLLAEGLGMAGKTVIQVAPRGKLSHELFVEKTGWAGGRTNQHCRDAGILAYQGRRYVKEGK